MKSTISDSSLVMTDERPPEIRIFISSTFRDMQPEREYIIKHVFPELRMLCRERGVEFTEIDLRWGVTREEAEQGKVLKICLDEIDRCRPYFLGILGERYGWTPRLEDVQKDAELLQAHPWIVSCIESEISVTEMEMLYGVLENPAMADHAFFYFRDPQQTLAEHKETSEPSIQKLRALKSRIQAASFPVHENFPDPPSLGKLIREDLLKVIEENFPLSEAPSALERKRAIQESYAMTRRRSYIPRIEYLTALNEHVESDDQPLVITGESGSGKSSLVAYWANDLRRKNPDTFLIQHYVGSGASDVTHLGIIQRVMEEIKERYSLDDDIPVHGSTLEKEFPSWLAKIQNERLILIIDSLDRLAGISSSLTWMPKHFPPSIRVILSSTAGNTLNRLRGMEWRTLEILPLQESECDQLIVSYLSHFRKALSKEQRALITGDRKSTNPLFLRTVLEELRIFGSFEHLNDRIAHYMESGDMSDLFQRLLARMENDYGHEILDTILSLIWASRKGLSESEIMDLVGVNRLQLSHILLALEFQLMRRSGLLDFYHDYLRKAVEARYLEQSSAGEDISPAKKNAHLQLAEFYETKEMSERKAEELPWQLQQANEPTRLKNCIADLEMFMEYSDDDKQYELLSYWKHVSDFATMEDIYNAKISEFVQSNASPKDIGRYFDRLGHFFYHSGRYSSAVKHLQEAFSRRTAEVGEEDILTQDSMYHLAVVKWRINDFAGAESLYRRTLELREKQLGRKHTETARILYYLGNLEQDRSNYSEAKSLLEEALDIFVGEHGEYHPDIAKTLNLLAIVANATGDNAAAEKLYLRAIDISEKILGSDHPATATSCLNLGQIYYRDGKREDGKVYFSRAITVTEKIFGKEHPQTIMGLNSLAISMRDSKDFEGAKNLYRELIQICEKLLGPVHAQTAIALNNLAEVLHDQGKDEESESAYRRSHEIFEELLGKTHPNTAHPIHGLGKLFADSGQHAKAAEQFEEAYLIRKNKLGDHPETLESLQEYRTALQSLGKLDDAQIHVQEIERMKLALSKK